MPPLSPSFNGYNLVTAVKSVFRKYARFSGRAVLSEFWYWMLFCFLLGSILGWTPSFIFGGNSGGVLGILLFIPTLAVIFRRLHDTGKSGWYSCLLLLPGIGFLIILILCLADSQKGTNQYGPSEKYPDHPFSGAGKAFSKK